MVAYGAQQNACDTVAVPDTVADISQYVQLLAQSPGLKLKCAWSHAEG